LTPGVKSAALSSTMPMMPPQEGKTIVPEGYQFPKGKDSVSLISDTVDEHYFDTMGVGIVRGRGFNASDSATSPRVAIVNEVLAAKYWPSQDPVGKRLHLDNAQGALVQIVGVAKTGKYIFISEPPLEFLYLPLSQNPKSHMTLIAQSEGDAQGLAAPLREVVRSIDPNQPIYDVRTMEDFYQTRAVQTTNLIVQTVGGMGIMGLLLAMVGLYGLVAYSVSRRTREFGIRMAIGAESRQVLTLVLRQGLWLSLAGIAIGLVISLGTGRVLQAALMSGENDPASFVVVSLVLLAVTTFAAYVPALRASRVAPMKALRWE
jgi:predicted permease